MFYLLVYLYHFSLPGLLLCYLLGIRRLVGLLAFALSYALLILTLLSLEHAGASAATFTRLVNSELGLLLVLVLLKAALTRHPSSAFRLLRSRPMRDSALCGSAYGGKSVAYHASRVVCLPASVLWLFILFGALAVYLIVARPYLERFQTQAALLATGHVPAFSIRYDTLFASGPHWYWLQAYLCQTAGITVRQSLGPLALATGLTFCGALFAMGLWITARWRIARGLKILAAILAALFGLMHQGINVFSFVRYYAFAPAILNYVVVFAALVIFADFLQGRPGYGRTLWALPALLFTAALVHAQEALWACFFMGSMVIYEYGHTLRKAALLRRSYLQGSAPRALVRQAWKTSLLLALIVLVYAVGYILIRLNNPIVYPSPLVRTLPVTLSGFSPLRILAPTGQFYQVVTAWGLWVYFLALVYRQRFQGQTYLIGGLLLPVWTMFNPLTVDMFLRFNPSAISVLYRVGYAIPLALVGATLATLAVRDLWLVVRRPAQHGINLSLATRPAWSVICSLLALLGLIAFLFPIRTPWLALPYNRTLTLKPVAAANDDRWWGDLADFIESQKDATVISDLATTYVLSRLTGVATIDAGEWLSARETSENASLLVTLPDHNARWLLIINRRDGAPSVVGRFSGHWPEDVMNASRYYAPDRLAWIQSRPQVFRKIWERNQIEVYAVDKAAFLLTLPKTPHLVSAMPACWEGPGIRLDWTDVCPTDFIGYHIQCSEDGLAWQDIGTRREYCWSWFNHQGAKTDVFGPWSYCLPSGRTYFYRVCAVYASEVSPWSNVKSATVSKYR
ncbi:MAG: hypothetical protein HYV36_01680 [Lentisphaerae bacterium]|nr:hypothetical protein [Lentisphaerota bacterium]